MRCSDRTAFWKNKMKITLVNPPNPTNYAPHKQHEDLVYLGGIGYLDASLVKSNFDVSIVDAKHKPMSLDDIAQECTGSDIIGISSHWGTIGFIDSLSKRLKKNGKIVVVGGTLPSSYGFSESNLFMKELQGIDFCLIGEGEERFSQLIRHISDNGDLPAGVLYRKGANVKKSQEEYGVVKLEDLPPVDFSRFPHFLSSINRRTLGLQTERGCYANCNFCYKISGKPGVRQFSIKRVEDELSAILMHSSPRQIMFYDETFTANAERAKAIAKIVQSKQMPYTVLARADNLSKELVKFSKETGCQEVMIGIESFYDTIRKKMNKGLSRDAIEIAIRNCEEERLPLVGFFIAGYPGETEESLQYTITEIKKHTWLIPRMRPFMPLPGTKIYEELRASGKISEKSLFEKYRLGYIDSINQDHLIVNVSGVSSQTLIQTSIDVNNIGTERMLK